jgi:hypothetical protein
MLAEYLPREQQPAVALEPKAVTSRQQVTFDLPVPDLARRAVPVVLCWLSLKLRSGVLRE